MTHKCPYCEKEAKPRGLKNHVRLMSDDVHGEKGNVPDSFEDDLQNVNDGGEGDNRDNDNPDTDSDGDDPPGGAGGATAASDGAEAVEVTADDLTDAGNEEPPTRESDASDGDEDYPFDPNDEDAIRLDGDETLYVRSNGGVVEAKPAEGDYLLITDAGPVLWDKETDDRFEVVTA